MFFKSKSFVSPVGRPDWFLSWLKDVFLPAYKNPVEQKLEVFENALDKLPELDESLRKSLASTLTNEARIDSARKQDKRFEKS